MYARRPGDDQTSDQHRLPDRLTSLITYQRSQPVKRCAPVGFHLLSGIGVGQLVVPDGDLGLGRALGVELHIDST